MNDIAALAEQLFWDKIERAKTMAPEQRVVVSLELFDRTRRVMLDGIRNDYPQADEAEVLSVLQQRLELLRRLEQASCPPTTLLP